MTDPEPIIHDTKSDTNPGPVPFIIMYATMIARLTLYNDLNYAYYYSYFFDQDEMVPRTIMKAINNADITDLFNDEKVFAGLGTGEGSFKDIPWYTANGNKYVDFLKLRLPQRVNAITQAFSNRYSTNNEAIIEGFDSEKNYSTIINNMYEKNNTMRANKTANNIKLISLATSNYSGIYILADKRTPNTLWVSFRCSYSAKSTGIYLNPSSLLPSKPCSGNNISGEPNKEGYIKGMFAVIANKIYTIIQSMTYLAREFLGHTKPGSVKVCTTGHSLGGALSTIFAYIFLNAMRTFDEKNYMPELYNVFVRKVCCISLGAPRCFNSVVSQRFCQEVIKGNIIYKRMVNHNDIVPKVPVKMLYYRHPCTDSISLALGNQRTDVLKCDETATNKKYCKNGNCELEYWDLKMNYNMPLNCVPEQRNTGTGISHMIYLYIYFAIREGSDIKPLHGNHKICRVGVYDENTDTSQFCFYNLDNSMTTEEKERPVSSDNKITYDTFCTYFINARQGKNYSYPQNSNSLEKDFELSVDDTQSFSIPYTYNNDNSNYIEELIPDPPGLPNIICVPDSRYESQKVFFIQL